jgi:hypothetical protein
LIKSINWDINFISKLLTIDQPFFIQFPQFEYYDLISYLKISTSSR